VCEISELAAQQLPDAGLAEQRGDDAAAGTLGVIADHEAVHSDVVAAVAQHSRRNLLHHLHQRRVKDARVLGARVAILDGALFEALAGRAPLQNGFEEVRIIVSLPPPGLWTCALRE
jgi:hypothetical protein